MEFANTMEFAKKIINNLGITFDRVVPSLVKWRD